MSEQLPKRYDPEIEDRIYRYWEDEGFFHTEPEWPGDSYTIVIPPPNVTGELHIGHALNNTLQDIFIRWRRMQGYNALWVPGTDHAGIATQNVVEKDLANEGLRREDLGREKFLERVWDWKEDYGNRIIDQLKSLGVSCDWQRERFTMDEGLSEAVLETFVQLYDRGLIYQGKYIINWCPRCRTALADDEVEHEDAEGHLWHIEYPFKGDSSRSVTVATTRPETMLGDTAVAVHPDDERYQDIIGETLILPIVGREIPVIADHWVDPEFGSGAVKVTPAHDPNDFKLGNRHDLERVKVIDEDGQMTELAGEDYAGMDRFECRQGLVEDLRHDGYLRETEPYEHSVGHCYRCHSVIEPMLSDQWFVKMEPLAEEAMQAVKDGRITFHPERWSDYYMGWLEEVRDWCISRQLWWGHRLPVYYCQQCGEVTVSKDTPEACDHCGFEGLEQDQDVLDTWFSSALWPFSTLGWPRETKDLEKYYPTDTLVTDRGIIYFWVARMVMMGLEFMDEVPFSDVYIHGTILDEQGRKMSKSLGNGIDPKEMIDRYGADAVRFSLIMLTAEGQDIKLSESKFEMGQNFTNKVWNAARFTLMNLDEPVGMSAEEAAEHRRFEDRWILSRLSYAVDEVTRQLENFKVNHAAKTIYHFFWHEFCDWYVEMIKPRLDSDDEADAAAARHTLAAALDQCLRMLHPISPFITEELWQKLKEVTENTPLLPHLEDEEALIRARWDAKPENVRDEEVEDDMDLLQELISGIRNLKKEKRIQEDTPVTVSISCSEEGTTDTLRSRSRLLRQMAALDGMEVGVDLERPTPSSTSVVRTSEVHMHLGDVIDVEEEIERLKDEKADVEDYLGIVRNKLDNPDFLANAPEDVVQKEMDKRDRLEGKLEKIEENLEELS